MPHCAAHLTVSASRGNMHTPHTEKQKQNKNTTAVKVHSLLTHRRNGSRSYGGRQSRRRTAASSMGFAPGEGSSSACASAAEQPSLPPSLARFLSPALPAPPLCQRYQTDVSTWSGVLRDKKSPRGRPVEAAQPGRRVCSGSRKKSTDSARCCAAFKGMTQGLSIYLSAVHCFITKPTSLH